YGSTATQSPPATLVSRPLPLSLAVGLNRYDINPNATGLLLSLTRPVTQYAYDINDQVTDKVLPNTDATAVDSAHWKYAYNALGQQVQEIAPLSLPTRTFYDQFGHVTAISTPNAEKVGAGGADHLGG